MPKLETFGLLTVILALSAIPPAFAGARARPAGAAWRNAHAEAITAKSDGRASALRECNKQVAKLKDYTWGTQEMDDYRTCMAERGQAE
jgi:hypothetical protein